MPLTDRDNTARASSAAEASPETLLRDERRRIVRERWMHLLLLGFALSIVEHVLIMLRLWWVKLPGRVDNDPAPVTITLQELPPNVEVVVEEVELPDPNPNPIGPVTTEIDPEPNLSAQEASNNPDANSYGTIEAPGIGAIVGPGGPGGGIGIGSGKGGGGTSFFGVKGTGARFAFIVDVSGSMQRENRILTALSELIRSVNALQDFTQFYVVLYSDGVIRPNFDDAGWMRATRGNKRMISQWIEQQMPGGGTNPKDAFELVFSFQDPPDVIFFLTDGEIPPDTPALVADLAKRAKREIVVNTIGFSSEAGREPLQQIARENRGVFRFVPSRGGGVP